MSESRSKADVASLAAAMERIAPTRAAEDWDNVGLLAGDAAWPVRKVLLTIDMTAAVLDEAKRGRIDAVVSYHPPIFRAVKRMVPDRSQQEGLAAEALAHRIAIYSPHTALDAAPGGTNDTLASLCGLRDLRPMTTIATGEPQCKLVVFVPVAQVEGVAEAIFAAGAGRIGEYEKCSYRLSGEGTFFGTDTTNPAIGKRGRLERVEEIRLEAVLPKRRVADVTTAVRRSHPYEEPAFDVYPLEAVANEGIGSGRIGDFAKPVKVSAIAKALARKTGATNAMLIGGPGRNVKRGIVYVGAAGSMPFEIACDACGEGDVVITGEVSHHSALRYQRCGAAVVALGHWASERPALRPLAVRLKREQPDVEVSVSRADRDPFARV
ncbi:MAG: Nif3-like dinuclear metal center hexameric protein [Planctomycetota bacterium]